MTENLAPDAQPAICPWCSAELASDALTTCTSCGATLTDDAEGPGLTTLDHEAISRVVRDPLPQRRSRLMSWITGDDGFGEANAAPGSLSPPPDDVRREMLRLELQAQVADLEAEAVALAADAREAGDEDEEHVLEAAADEAAELREVLAAGDGATGHADADAAPVDAELAADPDAEPASEPDAAAESDAEPAPESDAADEVRPTA